MWKRHSLLFWWQTNQSRDCWRYYIIFKLGNIPKSYNLCPPNKLVVHFRFNFSKIHVLLSLLQISLLNNPKRKTNCFVITWTTILVWSFCIFQVGCTVEVTSPDTGKVMEGVVNRLTDTTIYTVGKFCLFVLKHYMYYYFY